MSNTPWSRSSSVPSDRIPPSRSSTPSRNKGKAKANHTPKSKNVLRLEGLLEGLKTLTPSKDPKGGCFCQSREHPLSKYTPICLHCGLVLCSLQQPFYSCPHCASPLTSPTSLKALVQKVTEELSEVLVREAEQRELELQELHKAAGAFPTLSTSTGSNQTTTTATTATTSSTPQPRKVLSLNAQTRKVTVSSYMVAPVRTQAMDVTEEVAVRVPPPPKEVDYVRSKPNEDRLWQNLRDGSMNYVPLPTQSAAEGSRSGRRRKKGAES